MTAPSRAASKPLKPALRPISFPRAEARRSPCVLFVSSSPSRWRWRRSPAGAPRPAERDVVPAPATARGVGVEERLGARRRLLRGLREELPGLGRRREGGPQGPRSRASTTSTTASPRRRRTSASTPSGSCRSSSPPAITATTPPTTGRSNPDYGTNADFLRLLDEAHRRGIRVIVDLVVNHSGAGHPWFVSAASSPASPIRDFYVWSPTDPGWKQPWGGNTGTWHPSGGAYYYGVFWSGMPDLNWRSPALREEVKRIASLWLDRGVDGFRLDATRYLVENGAGPVQADTPETHAALKEFAAHVRRVKPDGAPRRRELGRHEGHRDLLRLAFRSRAATSSPPASTSPSPSGS